MAHGVLKSWLFPRIRARRPFRGGTVTGGTVSLFGLALRILPDSNRGTAMAPGSRPNGTMAHGVLKSWLFPRSRAPPLSRRHRYWRYRLTLWPRAAHTSRL